MHLFLRRSVPTVIITGGVAAVALELAGAATAMALTFLAIMASPVGTRALRWSHGRGASTLADVPTQRVSTPES